MKTWYPLGNDEFQIDHGKNYFRFFERIGELHYLAICQGSKVVGCCGFIRRSNGVWYLCDLKIAEKLRGRNLPTRLFLKAIQIRGMQLLSDKFYGICMFPTSEKILRIIRNSSLGFAVNSNGYLLIYSLGYNRMKQLQHLFGMTTSFLDISDRKQLVLKSTGKPIPVLHLQRDGSGQYRQPQKGFRHMFCLHESSVLANVLPCRPISKALIVSRNMENNNWEFVNTSEI